MPFTPKRDLFLFDIDGVVADDTHRVQFALDKDWGSYFSLLHRDAVLEDGKRLALEKSGLPNAEVQYLTGRRIDLYETTKTWLISNGFPNPEAITMRGFAHKSILAKYKAGVIQSAVESERFSSVHLFEDDPAVVDYVNSIFGNGTASLCTWYVKKTEMVKRALA